MTRVAVLRSGYAALGLAFAALAGSFEWGSLVLLALAFAIVAGVLLAFSQDDLPKRAGLALLGYFLLTLVLFLAATPITIDRGDGYFVNPAPPELAGTIFYWTGLLSPLVLVGAAIVACWEREQAPRVLLFGALAGFVLVALLTLVLVPQDVDAAAPGQGRLLGILFALSAAAGAVGALWAAWRAEE